MQTVVKNRVMVNLCMVLFVAGCTPPQTAQRISAFATATANVSENVADAFRRVDESYIATAAEDAVNKVSKGDKVNPKEIAKPFLNLEEYEARASVLRSLSNYAALLAEIMGDTPQKQLDAQVDQFAASLKQLSSNKTLQGMVGGKSPLTNEDIGILATAINELARLAIDYKRTKEARAIIQSSHENVEQICDLLQKDIGAKRSDPGLRSQLYIDYDKRINERFQWIENNSIAKSQGKPLLSPVEQRTEIFTWLTMAQDQEKSDSTMERIYQSLGTLRSTHSKLLTAFNDSAPELDALIGLLKAEAERVSNRYNTLKK